MLIAAVLYSCHALYFLGDYKLYLTFDALYVSSSLAVYPMYYCYVKLLTSETNYRWFNTIHFMPSFILGLAMGILHIAAPDLSARTYLSETLIANNWLMVYTDGYEGWLARLFMASRLVFGAQVVYYTVKSYRLVNEFNNRLANFYSHLENRKLIWVKMVAVSLMATSIMSFIANIVGRGPFSSDPNRLMLASLLFSSLLFAIGLLGNKQHSTVIEMGDEETQLADFEPFEAESPWLLKRELVKLQLIRLIKEEKIFLTTDLHIKTISQRLDVDPSYTCQLIRQEFGENFNSLINRHRISHAKQLMKKYDHLSPLPLEKIATESGFATTTAFIKAYRSFEDVSPLAKQADSVPHPC